MNTMGDRYSVGIDHGLTAPETAVTLVIAWTCQRCLTPMQAMFVGEIPPDTRLVCRACGHPGPSLDPYCEPVVIPWAEPQKDFIDDLRRCVKERLTTDDEDSP